jgi:predicted esterase
MINLFHKKNYFLTILFLFASNLLADSFPNYSRENNINEQITSFVFDSDIIEIDSQLENKFNLVSHINSSDTSILLLHGRGLHPTEPNVINPLRTHLLDKNYNVYSLQLPVLSKGKTYNDYFKIFSYSDSRIQSSIDYISADKIFIIAHSCGAHMLLSFMKNNSPNNITGIILIGAGAVDKNQFILDDIDLSHYKGSLLNIYGEHDHNSVKSFADSLKSEYPVFESLEIQDADHNYLNEPDILIELVNQWLKSS